MKTLSIQKEKEDFILYLRVIACIMILNSHCRNIYPIYFLALGGGHGNAIFFIISGFCLARINYNFEHWYKKRIVRILPALIFIITLSALLSEKISYLETLSILEIISLYVNKYWFAFAILIYYILFYLIFKKQNVKMIIRCLIVYALTYFIIYFFVLDLNKFCIEDEGFSPFKVLFYFGIFVIGGLIRLKSYQIKSIPDQKKKKLFRIMLFIAIISCVIWVAVYALISVFGVGYIIQGFIQICVFAFSTSILLCCVMYTDRLKISKGYLGSIIKEIGDCTLEIYLVQITLLQYVEGVVFPINWLLFWGLSVGGGMILHYILNFIIKKSNR